MDKLEFGNDFGQYLKELRGKRSLREMERLSGVSHVQLSNLEKGVDPRTGKRAEPSIETLTKLSKAFDVPLDDLMSKAYIKNVFVGFADDLEKQYGIKINETKTEKPAMFAGDDILYNIKSNPNVSLNMKPLKHEDRKRMETILENAFPEYFK